MRRHELSDEEWDIIAPLLPNNSRRIERVDEPRLWGHCLVKWVCSGHRMSERNVLSLFETDLVSSVS